MKIDHSQFATMELSQEELDLVNGAELTASDVAKTGLVALSVAPVFGPAAPAVAAVAATAVLFGSLIAGMDAG